MMRKRIRQNIDDEFRAGMDKIESLFSQWKESSPNLNKVGNNDVKTPTTKDESLETKHVEIKSLEESLMEDMEIEEDDSIESNELDQDFLVEDDVHHSSEVVFPFPCNDVISIVHTSQPTILVFSKFIQLYHVSMRAKNKSARKNKTREIKQSGKSRVIEVLRKKKEKEGQKWEES